MFGNLRNCKVHPPRRRLEIVEPGIIGELLQPGGVRTLERLELSDTVIEDKVDSVVVDGLVLMPSC